jgi:hypothetical protein
MTALIARKNVTINEGTEVLKKWASPDGDLEVILSQLGNSYSVTAFYVEVPEDGEEIEDGEEMLFSENIVRTLDKGRAEEKFFWAVPPAFRSQTLVVR